MKYALVTGASRGLGKAVALKLAAMGRPVLLNYKSNREAAEAVKAEIEAMGGEAELMPFDVARKDEVEAAIDAWEAAHPDDYVAWLCNNAGVRRDGVMFMMTDDDWHTVMDTTMDGFFYVTRRLLPKMMMRRHGGSIVNVSSLSGIKGIPGQANYAAAKAALIGATKALAQEVAPRNVTVNAVAPGFIETDMTKDLPKDELVKMVPLKRFGRPEEVAELVGFLLSDSARYITGEVVSISGGM